MDWGTVAVGAEVKIRRTDGRVHAAVISGLNLDTRSVTVEWLERGETKGKEIELDVILSLNPNLIPPGNNEMNHVELRSRPTMSVPPQNHTQAGRASGSIRGRQSCVRVPSQNGHYVPPATNVLMPPPAPAAPAMSNGNVLQPQTAAQTAAARRRSNVVKEVEKLKKNREERRARQAEQKAEKQELMNMDPGNPNWEFLGMIREYRSTLDFKLLSENDYLDDRLILVCVRKRPLNKKEVTRKEVDVVTVPNKEHILVHEPKLKVDLTKYLENQIFRFDCTFDESISNEMVYKFTAQPLVQTIFEGGMATCFAYGQTGSGKTHTMGGDFNGKSQDCTKGIYALAAKDIFRLMKTPKYRDMDLTVSASFFEIYSGKVFDLLNNKKKIRILEDGKQQVQLVGLQEKVTDCMEDVLKLIQHGNTIRTSGQTSANQHSSRSHAVFQLILKRKSTKKLHGKFSFIDLAGNERGADTLSTNRQTRMEGAEINKSLLALKECIRALSRRGAHLPFRASKLTLVLRDSFLGENTRICMIATVSPGMSSCELTLNTLRYADRLKEYGAQDLELKQSPGSDVDMDNGEDNDLAQIRSMNEGDLPHDLYTFHETLSYLQEIEDEVLDGHKAVIEASQNWLERDTILWGMTDEVDYDLDAYAQQLELLLTEKVEVLSNFKEKLISLRRQLVEEEKISEAIKRPNK
ncbi:hypothetical protein CHUAL_012291 [Chamberlinius hualienensis]